ncbi:hypothetical protein HanHA300_Chr08g0294001 [Helianthus annuus]|nr:hypothetical protein HanHA300_Chr08g0294001 [Helianthus annuus]KAJ0548474.1 hypothetical protein HanIR_Chr08g0384231 [Helianthus annuus]KAJ0554806.1 hypothetical protein HanHA89_Chr08g0312471 [Helianthus annuus]KAJ0720373.1 hypothetical protein HanLR1_Chr08g0292811 [Helianthus annuus]
MVQLRCLNDNYCYRRILLMANGYPNYHQSQLHMLGACLLTFGLSFHSVRLFVDDMQYLDLVEFPLLSENFSKNEK